MDNLYADPQWQWLREHLTEIKSTNPNVVTSAILSRMHQTGKTSSSLIAHFLRTFIQMDMETKKKEMDHAIEKENLLKVIFKLGNGESSTPSSSTTPTPLLSLPSTSSTTSLAVHTALQCYNVA